MEQVPVCADPGTNSMENPNAVSASARRGSYGVPRTRTTSRVAPAPAETRAPTARRPRVTSASAWPVSTGARTTRWTWAAARP